MTKVALIDYKMGNLFSVDQACRRVGLEPIITSNGDIIQECAAAILPGVGAFGEAMSNLKILGLVNCIKEFIQSGKPFMGVCLGFQLLFSESEEFGCYKGLDVLHGLIKKLPVDLDRGKRVKVPQIGWNQIFPYPNGSSWADSPLDGIKEGEFMYFVHSYYVDPEEENIKLTRTYYDGFEYCSSINVRNIFASQYHPEKSAIEGLKIYRNWADNIFTKEK